MADTTMDTGALSTEKITYRRYVKFGTDKEGKTVIDEQRILAETAAKDKKTGLSANWQKAEDDGLTLFSSNEMLNYQVKTSDGFELLVPDETQRLYIIQVGLDSVQTARANAFMKATAEEAGEPTPSYNDETLDLRVGVENGEYSINTEPSRRTLTNDQKLEKTIKSLGLSDDAVAAFLVSYAQNLAAQSAAKQEPVTA
jgi:hypothetical protein